MNYLKFDGGNTWKWCDGKFVMTEERWFKDHEAKSMCFISINGTCQIMWRFDDWETCLFKSNWRKMTTWKGMEKKMNHNPFHQKVTTVVLKQQMNHKKINNFISISNWFCWERRTTSWRKSIGVWKMILCYWMDIVF